MRGDATRQVNIARMFSAVLLCFAATILFRLAVFVLQQSRSLFRFVFFWHSLAVLCYLPAGIVAAALFLFVTRRSKRPHFMFSAGVLIFALALGWALPHEPLVKWLLPPADVK
jgi:hypothetical protein